MALSSQPKWRAMPLAWMRRQLRRLAPGAQRARAARRRSPSASAAAHDEAGAVHRVGAGIGHRVQQPAHRRHDGRRAVGLAVHLVQPAGLEARRHQEGVGAGLDQVGQAFVEARASPPPAPGARAAASRSACCRPGSPLPSTTSWRARREHARQRAEHQVDALLRREPAHHAEQQRLARRPAGRTRACSAALHAALPVRSSRLVAVRQQRVGGRVPQPRCRCR